jgi:transformation/transcription domain-associated protein
MTMKRPPFLSALLLFFFRRECVVCIQKGKVVIGVELPLGVQLEVSTIALLRSIIRDYPGEFFDADTTTSIGKRNV